MQSFIKCVYTGPVNKCRVCGQDFTDASMKNHLTSHPKCAKKMREIKKDWQKTVPFTYKRGNSNFFNCLICERVIRGKIAYYNHKESVLSLRIYIYS